VEHHEASKPTLLDPRTQHGETTQFLFEGDQIALHIISYANVGTDVYSSQGEIFQ